MMRTCAEFVRIPLLVTALAAIGCGESPTEKPLDPVALEEHAKEMQEMSRQERAN